MSEKIYKLQPDRTVALRGFAGFGAAASIHSATPAGFQVSGVFRDPADFAVVVLWDADNFYEHPRLKYLPDFRLNGAVLSFDLTYTDGLQPIDSPKYNWIDWATLDCIRADESTAQIRLWDNCVLGSGTFTAASGTFQLATTADGIQPYDRLTLVYQNLSYDYIAPSGQPSTTFSFFVAGAGTTHSITSGSHTYTHVEGKGEGSADVAAALIAAINAGAGDPLVIASAGGTSNAVTLTARPGQSASVSATGGVGTTLAGTPGVADVAATLAAEINSTNWWLANPAFALRAQATGASLIVTAARYGTVAVNGTAVQWVSGTRFSGLAAGQTITINGSVYSIAAVASPISLSLTALAPSSTSANYVADRGGRDGNMITLYALNKTPTLTVTAPLLALSGGSSAVTWRCSLDFSALGVDQLRQCWLTFAPSLANGVTYATTEWQASFANWTLADPNNVTLLQVAGHGSMRIESENAVCVYAGPWSTAAPESGFYSGGLARRAGAPDHITPDTVSITYSCAATHDLYIGTSLYSDRGTAGVRVDGDAETDLVCKLAVEPQINTRRKVRSAIAAGRHTVALRMKTTGYFYLDFIQAVVASDVPDLPTPRPNLSPALDYSTDHSYKLPPSRILWILDNLGLTGPVNEYIGIFWWNQRSNPTASLPSLTVTFGGSWTGGDTVVLKLGDLDPSQTDPTTKMTPYSKDVLPADTPSTLAQHFASYLNETSVGVWAKATGASVAVTCRSPAYGFDLAKTVTGAGGTVSVSGTLRGGQMGAWVVDISQTPALNRAARDWHTDLYTGCKARNREVVTAGSMELTRPPDGFAAQYPDGSLAWTGNFIGSEQSVHCALSPAMQAYQMAMFDGVTDLQAAAGLTPEIQMGEYLWWFKQEGTTGGMAYYDAATKSAAQSTLGRPLASFLHPADNPAVNGGADAAFLRNRLRDHIAGIASHIHARYPQAICEVLFAFDVNAATGIGSVGGSLNQAVNLPQEWLNKNTAGFDRLKVEALTFGASHNLDLAQTAIQFATSAKWPPGQVRYLAPIFMPASAWEKEVAMALGMGVQVVNMWAFDQMCIFGLRWHAVRNQARSNSFCVGAS